MSVEHECKESHVCECYLGGTEPSEKCPLHGYPWPPRCGECGKFLAWPKAEAAERDRAEDCYVS